MHAVAPVGKYRPAPQDLFIVLAPLAATQADSELDIIGDTGLAAGHCVGHVYPARQKVPAGHSWHITGVAVVSS